MATKKKSGMQPELYNSIGKPKAKKAAKVSTPETVTEQPQVTKGISIKMAITLFPNDMTCINEIAVFMQRQAGIFITRSDAIKIALRKVKLDKSIMAIYAQFKAEDGRKQKGQP